MEHLEARKVLERLTALALEGPEGATALAGSSGRKVLLPEAAVQERQRALLAAGDALVIDQVGGARGFQLCRERRLIQQRLCSRALGPLLDGGEVQIDRIEMGAAGRASRDS